MPYENISDFLSELQDDGGLRRVPVEVDPVLEVTEILNRLQREHLPPALLFEHVRGSAWPLVVNLLGSAPRVCRALGIKSFDEIAGRVTGLLRPDAPENWVQRLKSLPQAGSSAASGLTPIVRTGACQQVVKLGRDVDLTELPAVRTWPLEEARFVTSAQIYTRDPEGAPRCLETFPLEIRGRNTLAPHWHPHLRAWQIFQAHRARGTQMPIAAAIGGDPLLHWLAHVAPPAGCDPLVFAAAWRGKPLELVKCRQFDLEVPAGAEIVLEGYLDPTVPAEETGPVGRPTGFYSAAEPRPTVHVTALTHRSNPVFVASVAARPPLEEVWIQQAGERLLLPLLQALVPEVVDVHFPALSPTRNFCFVSLRKRYPQQAHKVLQAVWSWERTMFAKFVVVVDEDVNVRDIERVWSCVGANVHPARDVVSIASPAAPTDHATPVPGIGHKLGLDATRKFIHEGHPVNWPGELQMPAEIQELVKRRWGDYKL